MLAQANNLGGNSVYNGWTQVADSKGNLTNLWQRPPLLTLNDLRAFVSQNPEIRSIHKLEKALKYVTGVIRSPFEAQAAMLLRAPRVCGGYGLPIETDKRIKLTRSARKLAGQDTCFADIYIESPDKSRAVIVECQGAMIHSGERALVSDAARTTALESMGIDVVLLTYNHIFYRENLETVVGLIANKLGIKLEPRTQRMFDAETNLRRELFINWETLGAPKRASRRKNRNTMQSDLKTGSR